MVNLAALTAAVYNRLKSQDDGAALRAQLVAYGASAGSIIPAERIQEVPLPERPLLAMREEPLIQDGQLYRGRWTWYVYDEPGQGYIRISTLATLVVAAYQASLPALAPGLAVGEWDLESVGQGGFDPALKLNYRTVALACAC